MFVHNNICFRYNFVLVIIMNISRSDSLQIYRLTYVYKNSSQVFDIILNSSRMLVIQLCLEIKSFRFKFQNARSRKIIIQIHNCSRYSLKYRLAYKQQYEYSVSKEIQYCLSQFCLRYPVFNGKPYGFCIVLTYLFRNI